MVSARAAGSGLVHLAARAVFVVRQDGTIAFSEGYADFRVRPEPSDVMEALAALVPSPHPSR